MEVGYVRNTQAFLIDPSITDRQLPLNQVYLGILASDTMNDIKADLGENIPGIPLLLLTVQGVFD
jgi:hypothetical protein